MLPADQRAFRVLFLCTGNSARSQIAEALLNRKGRGRFIAESAGSRPAGQVNPHAIQVLAESGIDWAGHEPRGLEDVDAMGWDVVITVCDQAREACPIFPGQPILAHWGMPDPAAVEGDDRARRAAFRKAFTVISHRIDLLLALPVEQLEPMVVQDRVQAIGGVRIPSAPGQN